MAARRRLLLLDFDGTLAPLVVDRTDAQPATGAIERLRIIADDDRTRVAIVSGRPIDELQERLGPFPGTLVGEHGWEVRSARGETRRVEPSAEARLLFVEAVESARPIVDAPRLERKRTSLVVHTRGVAPELAERWHRELSRAWAPVLRRAELELRTIDGGWELRARGRTKGSAIAELAEPAGRAPLMVYLGDDESDEDAFRMIARLGIGFGIHVGGPERHTWAQSYLPDVAAVTEFLEIWLQRLGSAPPRGGVWSG